MTFDLLSAIELTASAAIAITGVAVAMAGTPDRRIRLAAALAAWFGAVVALGASDALSYAGALGVPALGLAVMLPILVMTALTFATARGRRALADAPVPVLIALNVVRIAGVIFLLLHAAGRLPAPFAPIAGWGDIAVGRPRRSSRGWSCATIHGAVALPWPGMRSAFWTSLPRSALASPRRRARSASSPAIRRARS